jgi:glutamate-1-semialdehyde 2,1-aminomutase
MLTLFFTEGSVTSLDAAQRSDTERFARFFHEMLDRGIMLPPSQFEAWMISSAHDESIIDGTIEAAHAAMQKAAEGVGPS